MHPGLLHSNRHPCVKHPVSLILPYLPCHELYGLCFGGSQCALDIFSEAEQRVMATHLHRHTRLLLLALSKRCYISSL